MPATSPSDRSRISTLKPLRSQYLTYIRSSICAQSCASVPPAPAWMSTKQLFGSSALENMRRNSSPATSFSRPAASRPISSSVASSLSAAASSNSSRASPSAEPTRSSVRTTPSSSFFSLPSSWARCGLSQSFGSSSSRSSSSRRFFFASKSKIPPQLADPALQVHEGGGDLIAAFGFHGAPPKRGLYRRRQHHLRLRDERHQLARLRGEPRLPHHRGSAAMHRGALGAHARVDRRRREEVGLRLDRRGARARREVDERADRAQRVGEGHDGAAVQHAADGAQLGAHRELGDDALGAHLGEAQAHQLGEQALPALLDIRCGAHLTSVPV